MDKKIVIKKYENRRLYDATHSRYVNLNEVARAIQDGCDVQVLDASSGEDLTRLVMTQIIIEGAKAPDSAMPLNILREMVVASGKASQESVINYMRSVADMYKNALRGLSQTVSPVEMMQNMMNAASPNQAPEIANEPPVSASHTEKTRDDREMQELKRRIQELEALVLKSNKARSPKRKKVRSRTAAATPKNNKDNS
jgi:polyhydroxyalkanoate synthesis repressor PhaR